MNDTRTRSHSSPPFGGNAAGPQGVACPALQLVQSDGTCRLFIQIMVVLAVGFSLVLLAAVLWLEK